MTSTKKKDNMPSYSNTTPEFPNGGTTYGPRPATLIGGVTYIFPWVASARPGADLSGALAVPIEDAARTKTVCYMKGLKEKIQIQTSSGLPWQWRRVCFTLKGTLLTATDAPAYRWSLLTSNGMVRILNSVEGNNAGATILNTIFDGQNQLDWLNIFNAKLDNDVISVKYDKTRILQSGNASGILRNINLWHPMNKNLNFNDDEAGDGEATNRYSASGKKGMGDYYVVDFIKAGTGAGASDLMTFEPEATLYWHEK